MLARRSLAVTAFPGRAWEEEKYSIPAMRAGGLVGLGFDSTISPFPESRMLYGEVEFFGFKARWRGR
jgi:hypothetical protein